MNMIEAVRQNAKTAWWVGLILVIAGFFSLLAPLAAGISAVIVVGIFLVVGGASQLLLAFKAGSFGRAIGVGLLGALNLIAGAFVLAQPAEALLALTVILAIYFALSGVAEIWTAFQARPHRGWVWLLVGGAASLVLGLMIWHQLPFSGVWAVGVLVGVRLIMSGSALLAIGRAVGDMAEGAAGAGQAG